jgi:hypothetical protein
MNLPSEDNTLGSHFKTRLLLLYFGDEPLQTLQPYLLHCLTRKCYNNRQPNGIIYLTKPQNSDDNLDQKFDFRKNIIYLPLAIIPTSLLDQIPTRHSPQKPNNTQNVSHNGI